MSYDQMFQQALQLHESGQLAAAEQIYRQILETAPEQSEVLNLLGLIAQSRGVQSEAEQLFYRALKQAPERADIYFNLAFSFKLDQKPAEALKYFGEALKRQPDIAAAHDQMALIYEQKGDLSKAQKHWLQALAIDPKLVSAKINLAHSRRAESAQAAIDELRRLAAALPDEAAIWYYLARLYLENNQDFQAWQAAGKAKELAPASDEVRVILGQLARREEKYSDAKIYFEKALLLNPENTAARLGLADMLAQTGEPEAAERQYRTLLDIDPGLFEAHANLAEVLYRQKRTAEALEEYRAAVIINPQSAAVSNNLGIILKDIGDYAEAAGLFGNALKLDPKLEEAEVNLLENLVLWAEEDKTSALTAAENWLKFMPESIFAKHALDVIKGEKNADSEVFNARYFDNFADSYELVVKNIGYAVPLALAKLAGDVKGTVVDLGCGTGLVAEALKGKENQITGVDLSEKMLEKARAKDLYVRLVQADAAAFLQQNKNWDWIFAADVAGYIGDLDEIIPLARAAGQNFLFSVETHDGPEAFVRGPQGRFRHRADYVERLLQESGFGNIMKQEMILRNEKAERVKGMLFYGR